MIDRLADKAQVTIGATVSGGLVSSPVWLNTLTDWLQLLAVIIGLLVGLTTLQLNRIRIKKETTED